MERYIIDTYNLQIIQSKSIWFTHRMIFFFKSIKVSQSYKCKTNSKETKAFKKPKAKKKWRRKKSSEPQRYHCTGHWPLRANLKINRKKAKRAQDVAFIGISFQMLKTRFGCFFCAFVCTILAGYTFSRILQTRSSLLLHQFAFIDRLRLVCTIAFFSFVSFFQCIFHSRNAAITESPMSIHSHLLGAGIIKSTAHKPDRIVCDWKKKECLQEAK